MGRVKPKGSKKTKKANFRFLPIGRWIQNHKGLVAIGVGVVILIIGVAVGFRYFGNDSESTNLPKKNKNGITAADPLKGQNAQGLDEEEKGKVAFPFPDLRSRIQDSLEVELANLPEEPAENRKDWFKSRFAADGKVIQKVGEDDYFLMSPRTFYEFFEMEDAAYHIDTLLYSNYQISLCLYHEKN